MLGAIVGDIVGSRFERKNIKTKDFSLFDDKCRFTDDTVMTCAIADAFINVENNGSAYYYHNLEEEATKKMQEYGREFPDAGYGKRFKEWIRQINPRPYNSYGNGAAMRISGIFDPFETNMNKILTRAISVTAVTHDHPESICAVQATIVAMYHASRRASMQQIRDAIRKYYDIQFTLDEIRGDYKFDVSCKGSVPQAIEAFLESTSFEDAIRNAISIGGDSDTIAAITGAIAEQYYGVPEDIRKGALDIVEAGGGQKLIDTLELWESKYKN